MVNDQARDVQKIQFLLPPGAKIFKIFELAIEKKLRPAVFTTYICLYYQVDDID